MSDITPDPTVPAEEPPAADPVATLVQDGTFSDEALIALFEQQYAAPEPPAADPAVEEPPAVDPEGEPPAAETPPEPERVITEPPPADPQPLIAGIPVAQAEETLRWLQSLPPEQVARLHTPPVEAAATAGSPAPAVAAPATPPLPDLAVFKELAPELAPFLTDLQRRQVELDQTIAAQQAEQSRQAAYSAQQEQARTQAAIQAADSAFRAKHPEIHPDDVEALAKAGAQMQVFPALVQQHGDVGTAYEALLDTAMWANPRFRDRMLQDAIGRHATQAAEIDRKAQRAASLTGSGGSMPRTPPATPDTRGMDRNQLNGVIAAELETHLNQQ